MKLNVSWFNGSIKFEQLRLKIWSPQEVQKIEGDDGAWYHDLSWAEIIRAPP